MKILTVVDTRQYWIQMPRFGHMEKDIIILELGKKKQKNSDEVRSENTGGGL